MNSGPTVREESAASRVDEFDRWLLPSAAVRILLKAITVTAIALLGLVPAGPGRAAEVEPADLMAINKHAWQDNAQIGEVFRTHPVAVRNKGPQATQTGSATWEVKLPGNVEFYNESNFNRCQTIVPLNRPGVSSG